MASPLGGSIALARGFFFQSGYIRTLRKCRFDILELDAARLQQHQQMKQQIGALGNQMIAIVLDRGDHGFDSFLTQLLGAVLRALVEQLAGVGPLSSRCGPCIDGGGEIMDRETRHQPELKTCAPKPGATLKWNY